jgi:hypothetical protein
MAKFYGKIGYRKTIETEPGIWEETIIEKEYYGDLTKNTSKSQLSGSTNDDININNSISIVADPFACENFQHMAYVTFMNCKWKISNVEVAYPRILLSLGGLYHE